MNNWGDNREGPDLGTPTAPLGHMDDWAHLVVDYLDGTTDPADQAMIDEHLAGCPACSSRLFGQRETASLLGSVTLAEAPDGLEDRILGELFFPSTVQALPEPAKPSVSSLWHRRLRAWVPAAAAVAAVFIGMIVYGLVGTADDQQQASDLQVTSTVIAGQAQPPASAETATVLGAAPQTDAAGTETTAAAMETTTTGSVKIAAAGTEIPAASAGSTPVTITSRKAMVEALRTSTGPLFLALTPTASESTDSTATTTTTTPSDAGTTDGSEGTAVAGAPDELITSESAAWVKETVGQILTFTELEPLPESVSSGKPIYVAYLNHDHVSAFVDLLLAIAASVRLDVSMQAEADEERDASMIEKHLGELPLLLSHVLPQPAVARFSFTTSTTAPGQNSDAGSADPDEAGTHVLTVVFLRP